MDGLRCGVEEYTWSQNKPLDISSNRSELLIVCRCVNFKPNKYQFACQIIFFVCVNLKNLFNTLYMKRMINIKLIKCRRMNIDY